jgi:hypothetical protein
VRMLDLFCGRFGWGKAFAARGWDVVGFDLTVPPEIPARCSFVQQDILELTLDRGFLDFWEPDFICASSPCENFSIHRLRNFHPNPPHPELGIRLFEHTRAICEASGLPYVMENVQSAEQFVGPAVAHAGSFYLWGNGVPPLLPKGLTKGMRMDRKWCQGLGGHGSAKRNAQTAGFATIPPALSACVADYAERITQQELAV